MFAFKRSNWIRSLFSEEFRGNVKDVVKGEHMGGKRLRSKLFHYLVKFVSSKLKAGSATEERSRRI